jgi:uncharacterized membrane protein YhaH (DUF805 family)
MEKELRPTHEYMGMLGFILSWFALFLLLAAILFGRHIDIRLTLMTSLVFWIILIVVFALIFLINILSIIYLKVFRRSGKK